MQEFYGYLDRFTRARGPERAEIERAIWQRFGREAYPLVLDMSGFSLSVRRDGVVQYLGQVRRMQEIAGGITETGGGEVVKFVADNMFALFADIGQAVSAAVAIQQAFIAANADAASGQRIACGIGIAYGRLLLVPGRDYFGDSVNVASKLGEDLAAAGEVLVAEEAFARLPAGHGIAAEPVEFSLSGLGLRARLVRP